MTDKKEVINCGEHGSFGPLFSVIEKNLKDYDYKVSCKECTNSFYKKKG